MDVGTFLLVVGWCGLVVCSVILLLGIGVLWYENFTLAGKINVLQDRLKGYRRVYTGTFLKFGAGWVISLAMVLSAR